MNFKIAMKHLIESFNVFGKLVLKLVWHGLGRHAFGEVLSHCTNVTSTF